MKRILVVEDDKDIVELVRYNLEKDGYQVAANSDGSTGLAQIRKTPPDLLILDLMLPKLSGLDICKEVRRDVTLNRLPILILTAKGEEADRVVGLELGADDYVTKPFSMRELLARIRAVMRRYPRSENSLHRSRAARAYQFAGWNLNVPLRALKAPSGERVPITNGEFGLLLAFLARPNRSLSRDQLLELSRLRSTDVYDRSIDVQILRLRRKIETDPARPQLIKTERGLGYRLRASVTTVYATARPSGGPVNSKYKSAAALTLGI